MAANINATVAAWTTIAASNQPDTSDAAASICDDFHAIMAAVRREHSYNATDVTLLAAGTFIPTARFNVLTHETNSTVVQMVGDEGQERTLIVAAGKTPIFQHSAKLLMPDSADCYGSAGDAATFIAESASTWRCASFIKATDTTLHNVTTITGPTLTLPADANFVCWQVTTSATDAITVTLPAAISTTHMHKPIRLLIQYKTANTDKVIKFVTPLSTHVVIYQGDYATVGAHSGMPYNGTADPYYIAQAEIWGVSGITLNSGAFVDAIVRGFKAQTYWQAP